MSHRFRLLTGVPVVPRLFCFLIAGFAAGAGHPVKASEKEVPPLTRFSDCPSCPEMVALPDGALVKRSTGKKGDGKAGKLSRIMVRAFSVSRFEVTVADWAACVAEKACPELRTNKLASEARHPITNVSWLQAQDYVNWLSAKTGKTYRLPTGNEWQYAALGGRLKSFAWQDRCQYANHDDLTYLVQADNKRKARLARITGKCDDGFWRLAPVGSFKANDFGLHDTSGNVWEWTQSCWVHVPEEKPDADIPAIGPGCEKAELRGGSYRVSSSLVGSWQSSGRRPDFSNIDIGFRVARDH